MSGLIRHLLLAAVVALFLTPQQAEAARGDMGVLLFHGKGGTAHPNSPLGQLAEALNAAGFIVMTPDMPWSRSRIWEKSFDQAMAEIDKYVTQLRGKGAKKIIVGGHSLGANAALADAHHQFPYLARQPVHIGLTG